MLQDLASPPPNEIDLRYMARAIELARRGEGRVEPNPMVGCVVVRDDHIVAEGWHQAFGTLHAEANALRLAGHSAQDATLYVSLEPCCHHGKTPPCADAIIAAGLRRVVVGCLDPHPLVAGKGAARLVAAGIQVNVGILQSHAEGLVAPFRKRVVEAKPWVIGKWAMTLDGKLAAADGSSQWISNEASRSLVHCLRGRVDAILVGSATALRDDPLLTVRPAGLRTPLRVVLDSKARLPLGSRLVQTAREIPVLVASSADANPTHVSALNQCGVEVLTFEGTSPADRLQLLLQELAQRQITNLLVEGGETLLGALVDAGEMDEVYAFVGSLLVGGRQAKTPVGGVGRPSMAAALRFEEGAWEIVGDNAFFHGRVSRS